MSPKFFPGRADDRYRCCERKADTQVNIGFEKRYHYFLTTHYIEEAERLCDRVAFIVDGEIVRVGTVDELLKEAQGKPSFSLR